MMQPMIPAITIKAALAGFKELGLDTAALRAAINLSQSDLDDPFAAVSNDSFGLLWSAAFNQMPDPTLPTKAGFATPSNEFGMFEHLVASAKTVGEALHIFNLFLWLVSTNLSLRFTHDSGDWVWVENDPPEPTYFISEQWTLSLIYDRFRLLLAPFTIEEVWLSQEGEGNEKLFASLWGVPVRLGLRTGFRLAAGIWEQPNAQSNPPLHQTLRTVAEQTAIKQFEEAPLVYAIRTHLPAAIQNGAFSVDDVAAELGLSKRTLQRQLSAEALTFKELLDIYRQEQAFLMLQNGQQDLATLAYSLGYNEQSSFNRAFRRWTGKSPSQWLSANHNAT
ncbi:MAG: AraC family transcriptional regulator ligand-binding domain-containing protein [Chloroflexota bacterium]